MKLFYIILFLSQLHLEAQVMFKVFKDTVMTFTYSGGDEFNADKLDENIWKNGIGGRRVLVVQDLAFVPENVKLEQGLIRFYANRRDSNFTLMQNEVDSNYFRKKRIAIRDNQFKVLYTVGAIVSREKHHYGMYELRFKVQEGKGIWPAFWFYGGTKNDEIDVFELKGEKNNKVHVDVHCPSGCAHGYHKNKLSFGRSFGAWQPLTRFLHEGFNVALLEWSDSGLIWYINGYPLASYRGDFSKPMNLFLNTSVAKTSEAFSPGPDESTVWPNIYDVDYLRIWQPAKDEKISLAVNRDLTSSQLFPSDYTNRPTNKRGPEYHRKKLKHIDGIITIVRPANNKLLLKVLGKVLDANTVVSITGEYSKQEVTMTDKEVEIMVDERDRNLTIEFKNSCRSFSRTINLN